MVGLLVAVRRRFGSLERRWCGAHDRSMFQWLRRRRDARRLVQKHAEALISDYGPEDARSMARARMRNAPDRRTAAHWRRVTRAIVRMTGKLVDY